MVAVIVAKDLCYFPKEFFQTKDLRVLIKLKLCAQAVRNCHMFLLTINKREVRLGLPTYRHRSLPLLLIPEYCRTPEYYKPKIQRHRKKSWQRN